MAIGHSVMRRRAKGRQAEERDHQVQKEQQAQQEQQERNDGAGLQTVALLRDQTGSPSPDNKQGGSPWVAQSSETPATQPLPENVDSAAATDTSSVVVTDSIRVVVIEVRIGGPGGEAEQLVTLESIERREVPAVPAGRETPGDLARRAEERLGEEMKNTAAAAGGEKLADRILPAQGPAAAADVVDLKSDLHRIMLGQLDVPLAPYVQLPGIDRSLDTAEVAILVGGIVLGTVTANPALYSVCVKSLAHRAIANAAEEAIRAALSDYARPLPPVRAGPAPSVMVAAASPPQQKDVSPGGPGNVSPGGPGMSF